MKKTIMAALAAVLLAATACSNGNPAESWAFRSGDMQASAELYVVFQMLAFTEAGQRVQEENDGNLPETTEELLQMTLEGQLVSDWVSNRAREGAAEYFAVLRKFESLGLEFNENDIESIETATGSVLQETDGLYQQNGISEETVLDFYTYMMKKDIILVTIYNRGGEYEVSNEEIETYIRDTYMMADLLMMARPYGEPNSQEDEFTRTKAEEYLRRLQDGEPIEDLSYEWMLLNATTQELYDSLEKPDKRELRVVFTEENRIEVGPFIYDAIVGTPVGTSRIVEDPFAFILVDRIDFMVETDGYENERYDILRKIRSEDFEEKLAEWGSGEELVANQPVLNRHTPHKIKFYN